MSKNRENVVWQSENGTWNRGFFAFVVTGPDDEWDVEYNFHEFNWAATGLPTERAARDAWTGANPGGSHRVPWSEAHRADIERYDAMALDLKKLQGSRTSRQRAREHVTSRKTKSPAQLDREIDTALSKRGRR